MSGLRTMINDHGDRLSYYVNDGQPDELGEALKAGFAAKCYAEHYQKIQDGDEQGEPNPTYAVGMELGHGHRLFELIQESLRKAAAAAISEGRKLSKKEAHYGSGGFGKYSCGGCVYHEGIAIDTCRLVEGRVWPPDVCQFIEPKPEEGAGGNV